MSLFYPKMPEENTSPGVSPASSQLHSNPTLAAIGRIASTLDNPKGYPPYKPSKVPSYTNAQILYYLRRGQITNYTAFQKYKKNHKELLQSIGRSGESDEELTINHQNITLHNDARPIILPHNKTLPHQSITSHSDARMPAFSIPETIDSKPNKIIPTPVSGEKGLKINKITIL
jgi:hypothetical protein